MTHRPRPRFGLFNTEERILHSEEMSQAFQVGIWLPFDYRSSSRTYPVLYVLDGEFAFGLAAGLVPTLIGTGEIPQVLVVGIAYHGITGWGEHAILRDRDLCPPGFQNPPAESRMASFVHFFEQQLFPLAEDEYRGRADDRALFGFSAGGLFALHVMLTQPGMFRRHIAAACTWPGADRYLLECEQRYAAQPDHPPTDVYLSVGGQDEEQLAGFRRLTEALSNSKYPGLRLAAEILEGEGHNAGALAKSFLFGMRSVYPPEAQAG